MQSTITAVSAAVQKCPISQSTTTRSMDGDLLLSIAILRLARKMNLQSHQLTSSGLSSPSFKERVNAMRCYFANSVNPAHTFSACFQIDQNSIRQKAKIAYSRWIDAGKPEAITQEFAGEDLQMLAVGLPGNHITKPAVWFKRRFLRSDRQVCDYTAHLLGNIGENASPVVSKQVLRSRLRQIEMAQKFSQSHCLYGVRGGQTVITPILPADQLGKQRAAKLYVRVLGLDRYCRNLGMACLFVTATLDSKWHPNPRNGRNSWNFSTPQEGHQELKRRWRQVQKRFAKKAGRMRFVNVKEVHKDGCVHSHMLIYVQPENAELLTEKLQRYFGPAPATKIVAIEAKEECESEYTAFDSSRKQSGLATAASYIMKYIIPVIEHDVDAADVDPHAADSKASLRVLYDAHKATWGGRAIQIADVPGSSTTWDEIRAIKQQHPNFHKLSADGFAIWKSATTNDYFKFLQHLECLRQRSPKGRRRLEFLRANENGARIVGVEIDGVSFVTKDVNWSICLKTDVENMKDE